MMNNYELSKQIVSLRKKSEEIANLLKKIESQLTMDNACFKDDLVEKALIKMEKNVLDFRNLVPCFSKIRPNILNKNKAIQNDFSQNYQIKISKNKFGYHITLPFILPKFGEKKKSILIEPLNFAIKNYAQNNIIEHFKRAVFIVINCVNLNTSKYLIRDNDNYEYKDIINTLSFWFLPDDSFDCCSLYSETQIEDKNSTKIFIVPVEKFAEFYSKHVQHLI